MSLAVARLDRIPDGNGRLYLGKDPTTFALRGIFNRLGAQFDFVHARWYVPAGRDPRDFVAFVPYGAKRGFHPAIKTQVDAAVGEWLEACELLAEQPHIPSVRTVCSFPSLLFMSAAHVCLARLRTPAWTYSSAHLPFLFLSYFYLLISVVIVVPVQLL